MIEHGIVEASSYTPSRVLSPTLHNVGGDFVEVCYHDNEKSGETASTLNSQTQTTVSPSGVTPGSSKQNSSTSSDWKNVEDLLITTRTNSDALTFIPCESGSLGTMSEIELGDQSPLSAGDASVKYGDDSPGVHSTRSKTGITLSSAVTMPASSKAEVVVNTSAATDSEADKSSTHSKPVSIGMMT